MIYFIVANRVFTTHADRLKKIEIDDSFIDEFDGTEISTL